MKATACMNEELREGRALHNSVHSSHRKIEHLWGADVVALLVCIVDDLE